VRADRVQFLRRPHKEDAPDATGETDTKDDEVPF